APQLITPVFPAEKHDLLSDRIIGHLGRSAGRRRSVRRNLRPGNTVKRPRVVQISVLVGSPEHNYLAAGWIVSHRKIRACGRRNGGGKVKPNTRGPGHKSFTPPRST